MPRLIDNLSLQRCVSMFVASVVGKTLARAIPLGPKWGTLRSVLHQLHPNQPSVIRHTGPSPEETSKHHVLRCPLTYNSKSLSCNCQAEQERGLSIFSSFYSAFLEVGVGASAVLLTSACIAVHFSFVDLFI